MSVAHPDRNLLFGILALQMGFLDSESLVAALHAWLHDKTKSLGDILVERQVLRPAQRDELDTLVHKQLDCHPENGRNSLAIIPGPTILREELHGLTNPNAQDGLTRPPWPPKADRMDLLPSRGPMAKPGSAQRYEILRLHEKGGLGAVFVALDRELNRPVALKEIQKHHAADTHNCGRFVREAEITGGLEHPGIVPVYGLGQYADGRPFYAMRFIQGETLKEAIARYHRTSADGSGAQSPEFELRALLTRFVAVCNTIAYAHSRGVIHRDIKPSNIMLGKYGETLVVDWGLAKSGMSETDESGGEGMPEPSLVTTLADAIETAAGQAMGTPAYMSPEQASGRLDILGPASDVYSLGATLYAILTGRPPIEDKDTLRVLQKAKRGEWLPPRQVKPKVPTALEAICCKAMATVPSERYSTALSLAADVERWLADEPVAVYRERWVARSRRWMRRHRTLVSTAVGVFGVALLCMMVGLIFINDAWDKEATARQTADQQKEEARYNEYVAEMNLVQREYEANNLGHVRELLAAQVPKEPGAADWRNFEWYYWQRMAHRELLILDGHRAAVNKVAFSPDGRRLASASSDRTVRIWDAATGQQLLSLKGHTNAVLDVLFSPDGRQLASASADGMLHLWDAFTGQQLRTFKGHISSTSLVSFGPDGRLLTTASGDRTVRRWDTATGQELFALKGSTNFFGASLSPDGRRLVSAGFDPTMLVCDATTGKQLLVLTGHKDLIRGVSYSPDGRRLASASEDQTVRVWDAATGKELLTLNGHTGIVWAVVFSADSRRLASASADQTVRVWDADTGQQLLTLKGHTSNVLNLSFSPDGRRLASAGSDKTVRAWDADTGLDLFTLEGHARGVRGVTFSPDGRRLASASHDRTVRIWDAVTGLRQLTLTGHKDIIRGLSFSPDGQRIATASFDGTVRVWDVAAGQELLKLQAQSIWGPGVAFSPDGKRLAQADDDQVRVRDSAAGEVLLTLKGHTARVYGVSFSPDDRWLASASLDQTVRLWDLVTGQELRTLKGHTDFVFVVSFSPDGRWLASASQDQTVRLWDAATGEELLCLKGHTGAVSSVSFSPDGRRLASAGQDQSVRLWDTATGKELLALKGHTREVLSVSFSPDGRRLASASLDETVRIWETEAVSDAVWHQRELASHVNSLFEKLFFRTELLAALRQDVTLAEADRKLALEMARECREDPYALNKASWHVVRKPGASEDTYAQSLRQAEVAAQLAPQDGLILNTLGVALYRAGRYTEALSTMIKSEKYNADHEGAMPEDLAFLAMTQYQLGMTHEARGTLGRLQEMKKRVRWEADPDSTGFLREAEELIEGEAASRGK